MTDTLTPPLAAPARRTYNVLGVELSRETLSLVALALCAGIVLGARIQRSAQRVHGCEECERQRIETAAAVARGARDFEDLRRHSAEKRARADGGGEPGGSEGVSASPPAPSPNVSGRPPIEPIGGDVIATEDGAVFPRIPDPLSDEQIDDVIEAIDNAPRD